MTRNHRIEVDNEVAAANSAVPMATLLGVLVQVVRKLILMPLHSTIQMISPLFQNSKMIGKMQNQLTHSELCIRARISSLEAISNLFVSFSHSPPPPLSFIFLSEAEPKHSAQHTRS